MSVHLLQAEAIFDGKSLLSGENVLVVNENGKILEIRPIQKEDQNIQIFKGILAPGLVNTHCHLELSHMKNAIPKHTGMVDFLLSVVQFRKSDTSIIVEAAEKWATKMYQSGISLVGDICNTDIILQVLPNTKLKFYHFVESIGFNESVAESRFEFSNKIQQQYIQYNPSAVVPHAPYSVSNALFNIIAKNASDKVISIHHAESEAEQDFFKTKESDFNRLHQFIQSDLSVHYSKVYSSSVESFLPLFRNTKILLVHNVCLSENDLQFIKKIEVENHLEIYFAICINANLYIGNGIPDIELIQKYFPDRITIGTDSLASNDDLNMMHELQQLKVLYPTISNETWLKMLTSQGAAALDHEQELGSFKFGTSPGIVQIEMDQFTSKRIF